MADKTISHAPGDFAQVHPIAVGQPGLGEASAGSRPEDGCTPSDTPGITRRALFKSGTGYGAEMMAYRQTGSRYEQLVSTLIKEVFRPQEFAPAGTFGTGGDDWAAMQAAQDAAYAANGCVECPRGTIKVSRTVIIKVPTRAGGSQVTTIEALESRFWGVERKPNIRDDLSNSYTPIIQVGAKPGDTFEPKPGILCVGFTVKGLCKRTARPTGNRNDIGWMGDGIHVGRVCNTPGFDDVWVLSCQNGFNTFNLSGHITWTKCKMSDNFFGWWIDHQSGDYRMYGTDIDGNMFSSVGFHGHSGESRETEASGTGLVGWSMFGGHLGFGPYAVYQPERGAPAGLGGLIDLYWSQTSMEALGNRGVQLAVNSTSGRWVVEQVPHSFYAGADKRYTIAGSPSKDYAYWLGTVNEPCRFGPQYPVTTTSGMLGKIAVIQGTLTMPDAWRYWEVNNYDRLIDTNYVLIDATVEVPYTPGITGTPSKPTASYTVPKPLLRVGTWKVTFDGEIVAQSAVSSLRLDVLGGPNADGSMATQIGSRRCPVLAGSTHLHVDMVVPNKEYPYLFIRFGTSSGGADIGTVGHTTQMRVAPSRRAI